MSPTGASKKSRGMMSKSEFGHSADMKVMAHLFAF